MGFVSIMHIGGTMYSGGISSTRGYQVLFMNKYNNKIYIFIYMGRFCMWPNPGLFYSDFGSLQ